MRGSFSPQAIDAVYRVIESRRDMRHFRLECGELLVAVLMDKREAHIFGRRTLPEMDLMSVACAIQNLWQAARAEGLGMGWVPLFEPEALAELLRMPTGSRPVAVLCLGHVDEFYDRPMLEQEGWAERRSLKDLVFGNYWPDVVADDVRAPRPADGT